MYYIKQLFKTYARFESESYEDYLKTVHQRFGKILVIADKAPQQSHQDQKISQI